MIVSPIFTTKVLHGDVKRINLIITNLYSNAVNWTERGSIEINLSNEENNLIITITDSGCGIREEFCEQIFQPFFQIDKNSKGVGLGLAIVKHSIEAHG